MMGLGYGSGGMMGGFALLGLLFWAVMFIDLVLLGMWLWKQLQKK